MLWKKSETLRISSEEHRIGLKNAKGQITQRVDASIKNANCSVECEKSMQRFYWVLRLHFGGSATLVR